MDTEEHRRFVSKTETESNNPNLKKLQQRIENLNRQNKLLSAENTQLKTQNSLLQKQLDKKTQQIEDLNELENEYDGVINELEAQLNELELQNSSNTLPLQVQQSQLQNEYIDPEDTQVSYNSYGQLVIDAQEHKPETYLSGTHLSAIAEQHSENYEPMQLIFEYEEKQEKWIEEKKYLMAENYRVNNQFIELQKQFDIAIKSDNNRNNSNKNDILGIVSSGNEFEDEEAPLVSQSNPNNKKNRNDKNTGCVVCGWRLW